MNSISLKSSSQRSCRSEISASQALREARCEVLSPRRMDEKVLNAFGAERFAYLQQQELSSWQYGAHRRGDNAILEVVLGRVGQRRPLTIVEYGGGTSWGRPDENYGCFWLARVIAAGLRDFNVRVVVSDLSGAAPYRYTDVLLAAVNSKGELALGALDCNMRGRRESEIGCIKLKTSLSAGRNFAGGVYFEARSLAQYASLDKALAAEMYTQLQRAPFSFLNEEPAQLKLFMRPMVDTMFEACFGISRVEGGVSFLQRSVLPRAHVAFIRHFPSLLDAPLKEAGAGLERQLATGGIGLVTVVESEQPKVVVRR